MGLFSFWAHFNNAQEEGFEPAPSLKNMYITLQKRHFSASLKADVYVWYP